MKKKELQTDIKGQTTTSKEKKPVRIRIPNTSGITRNHGTGDNYLSQYNIVKINTRGHRTPKI